MIHFVIRLQCRGDMSYCGECPAFSPRPLKEVEKGLLMCGYFGKAHILACDALSRWYLRL